MANRNAAKNIINGAPAQKARDPFRAAVSNIAASTNICKTAVEQFLKRGSTDKPLTDAEKAELQYLAMRAGMERKSKGFALRAR